MEERQVPGVDGEMLEVRRSGTGPAVVFESGSPGVASGWTSVLEQTTAEATVVTYTRAGMERVIAKDPAWVPRPLLHAVEDLAAVIRSLHLEAPVLVGHSLGGIIVGLYALRDPDGVRGIVLVDPTPVQYLPHGKHRDETLGWVREFEHAEANEELDRLAAPGALGHLPVRLIVAGRDYEWPEEMPAQFRGIPPGVPVGAAAWGSVSSDTTITTADAGHSIPREAPASVATVVEDLLEISAASSD